MVKRILGRTGIEVSAVGIGGLQFTGTFGVPVAEADQILDYAFDHGINLVDTAPCYGYGESEQIVGRAILRNSDKKIHLAEKVGHLHQGILTPLGQKAFDAFKDYDQIMRCIKHSMWVLRMDHLELLMMHEVEREWEANLDTGDCAVVTALEDLKKQGVVANIGITSWDCNALARMAKTGRFDVVLVAGGINLVSRPMYKELVPACQAQNMGIMVGGSLGQNTKGLVVKDREGAAELMKEEDPRFACLGKKLDKLYDLADELNINMVPLVERYILAKEEIHAHTMGCRFFEHVVDNVKSYEDGPLAPEYVKRIEEIQDMGEIPSALEMANRFRR